MSFLDNLGGFVAARAVEPSTWTGIATAAATIAGTALDPAQASNIAMLGTLFASGALALFKQHHTTITSPFPVPIAVPTNMPLPSAASMTAAAQAATGAAIAAGLNSLAQPVQPPFSLADAPKVILP